MNVDGIRRLLPAVLRRADGADTVLDGVLGTMDELHRPVEDVLGSFDRFVDPMRCPAEFVPYLATWVGLEWLVTGPRGEVVTPSCGDGPLRHLVARAADLARRRGTVDGLSTTLRILLDIGPTDADNVDIVAATSGAAADGPFHISVTLPASRRAWRDLIELVVAHEKPAFVTADVRIGDGPARRLGPLPPLPPLAVPDSESASLEPEPADAPPEPADAAPAPRAPRPESRTESGDHHAGQL